MKAGRKKSAVEKAAPSLRDAILGTTAPATETLLLAIGHLRAKPAPPMPTPALDPILWPEPKHLDATAPAAQATLLAFLRDATPDNLRDLADALEARTLAPSSNGLGGVHPRPVDEEKVRVLVKLHCVAFDAHCDRFKRATDAARSRHGRGRRPRWEDSPGTLDDIIREPGRPVTNARLAASFGATTTTPCEQPARHRDDWVAEELSMLTLPVLVAALKARGVRISQRRLRDIVKPLGWRGQPGRPK
jgi:hypothetical protein